MKYIITFLFAGMLFSVDAQAFDFEEYTWEEDPTPYTPEEDEVDLAEIELKYTKVLEFIVTEDEAYMMSLFHTKKYLNSSEAIERNNKIYLPISFDGEIEKQIARVILPNGDIIELDEDDILQAEDESSGNKYNYFALEGLEEGATMEYISVSKFLTDLSGATYTLQDKYLTKDVSFDIYFPSHLVFEFKSYNGFPEMEEDTVIEDYNHFGVHLDEIPPAIDEEYQNYNANLQKISYKLTGNHYSRSYNLNSFTDFATDLHSVFYQDLSKKEDKILGNIIKDAGIEESDKEEEKIRKIEDYIKTTIIFMDKGRNLPTLIEDVMEEKVAGEIGLFILYAQLYKKMGIKHEVGATTNRFDVLFDKDFENMNHLEEFFFYFPKSKNYQAPTEIFHRYPFIPYQWTENYGFFVKTIEMGGVGLGSGKAKYIQPLDMSESVDILDIYIDFSDGVDKVKYDYFSSSTGYDAVFTQSIFSYVTAKDEKEEFREELAKVLDENMEVENLKTENEGAEFFGKEPYIISCEFTSDKFIDQAGSTYLLKIGELIGPQMEMYNENKRQSDVEFSFAKVYERKISFDIPEGYQVKNLEKVEENIIAKDEDGEEIMGFVTTYSQKGTTVTIENKEFYNRIRMKADPYYEPFKNVVNAAADFNKIVLVLEPQ